jgi:cytochrome b6-f complex iron-sulfur subunit
MAEEIPGFERDPEMEDLLEKDVLELDEDTRSEVQLYKSRLLQAKRDADMSESSPPWSGEATSSGDAEQTEESADEAETGDAESTSEESAEDESEPDEDVEESPDTSDESESTEDIPGFETDPEMEKLLEKDIQDVDEDKRADVQKYKSKKMQAKQEAGEETEEASAESDAEETEGADEDSTAEGTPEGAEVDFEEDPEMEELLDEDIMDLDEETRVEVQKYKSQKMKARRAARDDESDSGSDEAEPTDEETDESSEPADEKSAPPADAEKRHDGERKIKDIVESRTSGRDVSRRGFLSSFGLGVAGFLGVLGLGGISSVRYFYPNVLSNPPEQFVAGDPADYPTNTVSAEFKSQYRVWIVNLGERIVAINAVCTHLGCTPNWLSSQGIFKCPCHGSGYYMNGVNFEGPAPRPMDRVGIRLSPTGKIVVDKSQKFASQASPGWNAKGAFIPA